MHFVLLGAAIFAASHSLEDRSASTRITITQDQIGRLSDNYRLQYGQYPSSEQLEALIDRSIREEIFYREALNLGLDANDQIIRRRLVQKYEFVQQDLAIPTDPTVAQLLEHYRQNLDLYRLPPTVTFTHVYISPDRRQENEAHRAAQELASDLKRQGPSQATGLGDQFPGSYNFTAVSRNDLVRVFGREGLTEAIFNVERGRWTGPVRSGLGWHVVYVSGHEPARQVEFDEAQDEVRRDYLETQREQRNAKLVEELRHGFQIIRE